MHIRIVFNTNAETFMSYRTSASVMQILHDTSISENMTDASRRYVENHSTCEKQHQLSPHKAHRYSKAASV